jgi:2-polyprenyl-6-methoxyphenol hydroxylase-like FAD-dependent oxidoreductase
VNNASSRPGRVAIVGAGRVGLAAALSVHQAGPDVILLAADYLSDPYAILAALPKPRLAAGREAGPPFTEVTRRAGREGSRRRRAG